MGRQYFANAGRPDRRPAHNIISFKVPKNIEKTLYHGERKMAIYYLLMCGKDKYKY